MDNEKDSKRFESVYSQKVRAGKRRTYFFDVRRTKGEDFYLTLTESTKRMDGGYDKHKVFLYKEDFNRFVEALSETVEYIKTELMPQYDYDEFARRQEEYEARIAAENEANNNGENGVESPIQPVAKPVITMSEEVVEAAEIKDFVELKEEVLVVKTEKIEAPVSIPPTIKAHEDDEDMSW